MPRLGGVVPSMRPNYSGLSTFNFKGWRRLIATPFWCICGRSWSSFHSKRPFGVVKTSEALFAPARAPGSITVGVDCSAVVAHWSCSRVTSHDFVGTDQLMENAPLGRCPRELPRIAVPDHEKSR